MTQDSEDLFAFLGEDAEEGQPKEGNPEFGDDETEPDRWATAKRKQIRFVASLFGGVVGFLLLVFCLNLWQLYRWDIPDLKLSVQGSSGYSEVEFIPELRWQPFPGEESSQPAARPLISLAGTPVPVGENGPGHPLTVSAGTAVPIGILIPPETAKGQHRGTLILSSVENLRSQGITTIRVPVQIGVTGGFLSPAWRTLHLGMVTAVLTWLLLHLACILIFPKPGGVLQVAESSPGGGVKEVRLRASRWALAFPWLRPSVSFIRLARQSGIPSLSRHRAEFRFMMKNKPVLYLFGKRPRTSVARTIAQGPAIRVRADAPFRSEEPPCFIFENMLYRLRFRDQESQKILLRYRSR